MNSSLSYCDYIAHTIVKPALDEDSNSNNGQLSSVGLVKMDLHTFQISILKEKQKSQNGMKICQ